MVLRSIEGGAAGAFGAPREAPRRFLVSGVSFAAPLRFAARPLPVGCWSYPSMVDVVVVLV